MSTLLVWSNQFLALVKFKKANRGNLTFFKPEIDTSDIHNPEFYHAVIYTYFSNPFCGCVKTSRFSLYLCHYNTTCVFTHLSSSPIRTVCHIRISEMETPFYIRTNLQFVHVSKKSGYT